MPFEDYYITEDGHLGLDTSGNFQGVEGSARIAQAVTIRLNTRLGEWQFKITIGVDLFGVILVKDPDITLIRADLVKQIVDVSGVNRVTQIQLSIGNDRLLLVTWEAVTDDGITIGGIV